MSSVLELDFITDQNKLVKIQIPGAVVPVDSTKVSGVMDLIIQSQALEFKSGMPTKKSGARILDTETTQVLAK
jgi:hypothetical protein